MKDSDKTVRIFFHSVMNLSAQTVMISNMKDEMKTGL